MPRAKVKLDLKTIDVPVDIPVDTGVTENLPVPVPLQSQAIQPMDAGITLDEALKIYWGPLSGKLDRDHMAYFFAKCKLYGLNPLKGQAHAVPRKRYEGGREVYDLQFTVAYTAMIEIAKNQLDYRGVKLEYYYRQPDGRISTSISPNPADFFGIIATGYIEGIEPIVGHFWWHELRVKNNSMWDTSPEFMTMKTTWMRILTLMYPGKFQGLYEESEFHDNMAIQATSTPNVIEHRPRAQAPASPVNTPKQEVVASPVTKPSAPPVTKPPTSPMDTLTQGSLSIPPATAQKVETPAKEPPPTVDTPQVEEAPFMEKVIDFAQIMGTGDVPYLERNDVKGYYSRSQHDLLCRLMKRHFMNEKDRLKIYSAMLGKDPDGNPIEIEEAGLKLNYLSVHKASELIELYQKHEVNVEEFIKNIVAGWGEENIKSLGLKVIVVKRLLGYVASEHTRGPVKVTAPDGTIKLQGGFQEFKNSMQAYGISFLKNEKVLATYQEVEKEMEEKKAKKGVE